MTWTQMSWRVRKATLCLLRNWDGLRSTPQFYRRQTGSIPDVKDILPISRIPTFQWRAPVWVNMRGEPDMDVPTVMKRADDAVRCLYALLVQTGVHAMIEWHGVMVEHFKMLEYAVSKGIDPRAVDQHSGRVVEVPDFMAMYMCEKLGCQLKPFIRGSAAVWRKAIEEWFAGTSAANRQPERTTTFLLSSGRECQELMNWLFESSQWFSVDPLPNDQWEVTVKSELELQVLNVMPQAEVVE